MNSRVPPGDDDVAPSDHEQSGAGPPPLRRMMPPYLVLRDFLDEGTVAGLLDHALSHQAEFAPTKLRRSNVNLDYRVSLGLRDLGPYRAVLKHRIFDLLPTFVAGLGMPAVEDVRLELELVAHGDGAFYKRHIDTRTGYAGDQKRLRILSSVYYFHAMPKAFAGGALRLYAIGDEAGTAFADIEPVHNSFLVFPSWAPHEVMPVSCPTKQFGDSRFAINCWLHRKPAAGDAG